MIGTRALATQHAECARQSRGTGLARLCVALPARVSGVGMVGCEWARRMVAGVVWSLAFGVGVALAQTEPSRVEAGGQLNVLRLSDPSDTQVGFGGRLTVNLSRWLSLEGEYQFVPDDAITVTNRDVDGRVLGVRYERRRSTALFGAKAGYRGERVGVFAKVRPGVTVLTDRGVECLGDVCALVLLAVPEYRSEFALDVGGVVEWYPSGRWVARFDIGSLIIRHRSTAPPCPGGGCTSANLATSIGFGVRF